MDMFFVFEIFVYNIVSDRMVFSAEAAFLT